MVALFVIGAFIPRTFLRTAGVFCAESLQKLWLAAYLTGFPPAGLYTLSWTHGLAPGTAENDT